jgi:hypothetical protein
MTDFADAVSSESPVIAGIISSLGNETEIKSFPAQFQLILIN